MIRLTEVSKAYHKAGKEIRALDAFSLAVARGEFVAVRGPSGSGKTTLLLTVGGMIRPTAGEVLLDGRELYSLSAGQRARLRAEKIGFVFQMFHLLGYLSVLENVRSACLAGGRQRPGASRSAARDRAIELLEHVGLADRLAHRPGELSAGERQRVAMARALMRRPELILADEPTGNLDPDSASAVMSYLGDYHRDGGTVLLVTHETVAARHAQRVVEMTGP